MVGSVPSKKTKDQIFSLLGAPISIARMSFSVWHRERFAMHEDLKQDFEMAQVKHLLFKSKLRSALYSSGTAEEPIRDAKVCALGVWIQERALVAYAHLPESRELDKVHQQIHQEANRLLDLHQRGEVEQAIAGLATVQVYVDEITRLLRTMEHKLRASSEPSGR
jgi:hypothetical protein